MRYYLDCEFDGFGGPLISLALVSEDLSTDLYCIVRDTAENEWVKEFVIPILDICNVTPRRCGENELGFYLRNSLIADTDIEIIADSFNDIHYFTQYIVRHMTGEYTPSRWSCMRFTMMDIESYPTSVEGLFQHNAHCDAMALRHKVMELGSS